LKVLRITNMAYKRTKTGSTTTTYNTRTGKTTNSWGSGTTRNGGTRSTYSTSGGKAYTTTTYKDAAGYIHTEKKSPTPRIPKATYTKPPKATYTKLKSINPRIPKTFSIKLQTPKLSRAPKISQSSSRQRAGRPRPISVGTLKWYTLCIVALIMLMLVAEMLGV